MNGISMFQPTDKKSKRNDIQILRALSIFLVIAYHLPQQWNFEGGFVGVDIFFVISGFVVSQGLITNISRESSPVVTYKSFMRKRLARLLPALSVALIGSTILGIQFASAKLARTLPLGTIASQFFFSNFYFLKKFDSYWNPEQLVNPLLHTWSLAVEFQIYLILPLIFVLRKKQRGLDYSESSYRKLFVRFGLLAILSCSLFLYLTIIRKNPILNMDPKGLAFYLPVTRLWEVLIGVLIALKVSRNNSVTRRRSNLLMLIGVALTAIGIFHSNQVASISPSVVLCCVGVGFFIFGSTTTRWANRQSWYVRLPIWIGDRSYSIYLWHWPLLAFCLWRYPGNPRAIFLAIAITLVIASFSYQCLEVSRPKFSVAVNSVIYLSFSILVITVSQYVVSSHWFNQTITISTTKIGLQESELTGQQMLDATANCQALQEEIHCLNSSSNDQEIVIMGDSLAYRTFPVVQFISKNLGLNASMMWHGGCGIEENSCPQSFYNYLETHNVVGIIIAMNFDRSSNQVNGVEINAGVLPQCPSSAKLSECQEHTKAVDSFKRRATQGLPYLLSQTQSLLMSLPFPQQALPFPDCLSDRYTSTAITAEEKDASCGNTSRSWQSQRQGLFPDAIKSVVAGESQIQLWDPQESFCDSQWCPAFSQSGEMIMTDAIHWSLEASRFYFEPLKEFIEKIDD
jgi:peptidoglycan/LPS O-acetylase OafA/YrhL